VNIDLALNLVEQMLWTSVMVGGPILGVSLVVGLLISIFQVVTQIQEMTLTFVPKIVAVTAVIFVLGHWMLVVLMEFATYLFSNIPFFI